MELRGFKFGRWLLNDLVVRDRVNFLDLRLFPLNLWFLRYRWSDLGLAKLLVIDLQNLGLAWWQPYLSLGCLGNNFLSKVSSDSIIYLLCLALFQFQACLILGHDWIQLFIGSLFTSGWRLSFFFKSLLGCPLLGRLAWILSQCLSLGHRVLWAHRLLLWLQFWRRLLKLKFGYRRDNSFLGLLLNFNFLNFLSSLWKRLIPWRQAWLIKLLQGRSSSLLLAL